MAALEILIVTTRQSRRWIVPKGWPIKRLTPSKSAAREAFEEAGVRGKIGARAIGVFRYKKAAGENGAEPGLRGQDLPSARSKAKRDVARIRTARGSVGRSGEGDFAHSRPGAEGDRRKVRQARGRRSKQGHLLTADAAAALSIERERRVVTLEAGKQPCPAAITLYLNEQCACGSQSSACMTVILANCARSSLATRKARRKRSPINSAAKASQACRMVASGVASHYQGSATQNCTTDPGAPAPATATRNDASTPLISM